MRLIKVRIKKGDFTKGEDQMIYPARYNPVEVDRMGMYATAINPAGASLSGNIGRGEEEEFCIIALPDNLAEEYAADPDMAIIDETEADNLMNDWKEGNGISVELKHDPVAVKVRNINNRLDNLPENLKTHVGGNK